MEKTELTIRELLIYKGYLDTGAKLCGRHLRFVVGVATNIERLAAVLKKTEERAPKNPRIGELEEKLLPLQHARQTGKIDAANFNTGVEKLNTDYAEEIKQRNDFLSTVMDFEPFKLSMQIVPDSIMDAVDTTPSQDSDAFNFVTALVKLKIV